MKTIKLESKNFLDFKESDFTKPEMKLQPMGGDTLRQNQFLDIETGGFLHCEITGITEGLVSEVYEKQSEPRKERKSIIIGAPSYHNNMLEYYRMLEDKKQIVIHGGRQMGGKTAFMKHLAFAYQESLITGIPFELMLEKSKEGLLRKIKLVNTILKPYSPMKPLTVSYKERFRLERLKSINNK